MSSGGSGTDMNSSRSRSDPVAAMRPVASGRPKCCVGKLIWERSRHRWGEGRMKGGSFVLVEGPLDDPV